MEGLVECCSAANIKRMIIFKIAPWKYLKKSSYQYSKQLRTIYSSIHEIQEDCACAELSEGREKHVPC